MYYQLRMIQLKHWHIQQTNTINIKHKEDFGPLFLYTDIMLLFLYEINNEIS